MSGCLSLCGPPKSVESRGGKKREKKKKRKEKKRIHHCSPPFKIDDLDIELGGKGEKEEGGGGERHPRAGPFQEWEGKGGGRGEKEDAFRFSLDTSELVVHGTSRGKERGKVKGKKEWESEGRREKRGGGCYGASFHTVIAGPLRGKKGEGKKGRREKEGTSVANDQQKTFVNASSNETQEGIFCEGEEKKKGRERKEKRGGSVGILVCDHEIRLLGKTCSSAREGKGRKKKKKGEKMTVVRSATSNPKRLCFGRRKRRGGKKRREEGEGPRTSVFSSFNCRFCHLEQR